MRSTIVAAASLILLAGSPAVLAQGVTGDPAAASAVRGAGNRDNPGGSGSGTSTSGARDLNNDQGRDAMKDPNRPGTDNTDKAMRNQASERRGKAGQ
jgi:hypothetical protein